MTPNQKRVFLKQWFKLEGYSVLSEEILKRTGLDKQVVDHEITLSSDEKINQILARISELSTLFIPVPE